MTTSPEEVFALGRDLADPERRTQAIRRLADQLGVDDLILFLPDPELGRLLPAPGFPQTLPSGRAWHAFLRRCQAAGSAEEVLPFPHHDLPSTVRGEVVEDCVLALFGGEPVQSCLDTLRLTLPLLLIALRREREATIARHQAASSKWLAEEHRAMAFALDRSQRELQRALQERHRARDRFAFLATVSAALGATLDVKDLIQRLPRVVRLTWRVCRATIRMGGFRYSLPDFSSHSSHLQLPHSD